MKKKALVRLLLIIVIIAFIAVAGYYFLILPKTKVTNPTLTLVNTGFGWKYPTVKFPLTGPNDVAYSDIRDPGGIPQGLPVRLKIPVISVDSAIEDALITADGRMDVPQGSVDVAWFALGPHPGQVGSAVIGGHFGIRNGVKFVFYDLDKMKIGDKAYIEDDEGNTLAFQVRSIKLFERDADATTVFTSEDGLAHLNLITCEGVWNQINGAYPQRRVVFMDAIAGEGTAPMSSNVPAPTVAVNAPKPTDTPTTPTNAAIEPTPEPTSSPIAESVVPTTPENTPTVTITSPLKGHVLIQAVKDSFSTPIAGIVTSILILAILFMAVKILRL